MRVTPWATVLVLLLSGCGDDEETSNAGPPSATLSGGTTRIEVNAKSGLVGLWQGDVELLVFPADAFVLGTVAEVTDAANYDPAPMLSGSPVGKEPEGMTWRPGQSLRITASSEQRVELQVSHFGGLTSKVILEIGADGRYRGELVPMQSESVAYLRLAPRVTSDEAFYGLGEWFDSVNHRGKLRAMQLEVDGQLESSYNEAHVPIPFVTGSRGWGFFVQDPHPAAFDVAKADAERVAATFGLGLDASKGLVFHLFAAGHPLDVTKQYYEVTGYPRLPARWGLGPLVWRDENDDQAQFEADLQTMRDLDLPSSAVWIDRPYATAVNSFDFDATQFPDPKSMLQLAHALGFRVSLWHTPYLDEKTQPTPAVLQPLIDEAKQKGYYPLERGIPLNKWGTPIDLTNPEAFAWWQGLVKKYTDMGIEGFKLDYGEDVVPGAFGARNVWKFADGSDERTMHALYQLFYHRAYAELFEDESSFLLCRGGTYGDQSHVTVIWPGDLDASFAKHGEKVSEKGDTYTAVGGLPAALIAGLSLGPSGFPFFGSDTGGYRHSPPDKELFTRWFQITALSPVMQIGTSTNDVAWEPTAGNGFDAEMLGWYRELTRLHLRLFPYIWTYAKRMKIDGRPIQRALGLAHPELGVHPDDTFLLGDDLLVAPIVERGKTTRDVALPAGNWVDWWTGAVTSGGKTVSVSAPLHTLPLYLRAGGIIPLLRPTIDTMSPTTKPGIGAGEVDSYATSAGVLWARVAPGAASTFELFDGAELGQEASATELKLSSTSGSELSSGVLFEILGFGAPPKSASEGGALLKQVADLAALEAAASGWAHSTDGGGTLWVKLEPGTHTATVMR